MQEGRFQHALDLIKHLYADEKSPENQELLLKVYLGRARQLRSEGRTKDAATVLGNVPPLLGEDTALRDQVAEEFAACGQPAQALRLLEAAPDSPVRARVFALAADAALERGSSGRAHLPEGLHAGFDVILRAFEQSTAGQDDEARTTLQELGLQSPFLEWKLLLRGLMAYYQNDDARALENWSRLSADRLPARLAAPLRMLIDPAFRSAQPPQTQVVLQRHADRLQGAGLLPVLRNLQAALAGEDLRRASKLAGDVLPQLKTLAPQLVSRLAAAFYSAIAHIGQPDDMDRYRRLFGPPADDAEFARLEAMALERCDDLEAAHKFWQKYERWVEANPSVWGADSGRVRALLWSHMGENAAIIPDESQAKELPAFLRAHPSRPKPLKPTAQECFRKAIELVPDLLEAHEARLHFAELRLSPEEADGVARQLLAHFPEHAPALQLRAESCVKLEQDEEALRLFERALKANPLDRPLRGKVCQAHARVARGHAAAKRFDAARAAYQAALALAPPGSQFLLLCQCAACEFRAGEDQRAEDFQRQAQADAGHVLPVAYASLVEAKRSKLSKALAERFHEEFTVGLMSTPSAAAATNLVHAAAAFRDGDVKYRGQKGHEEEVFKYLARVPKTEWTEPLLEGLCTSLFRMKQYKVGRTFTALANRRCPKNPIFPLTEAESYIAPNPQKPTNPRRVHTLLDQAEELAEELPTADERRQGMLEAIDRNRKLLQAVGMFGSPDLMAAFGQMLDAMGDDDDDW